MGVAGDYSGQGMPKMKGMATALAEPLGKSYPWVVGFFFGNAELSMELWTAIAGISGVDD